jgi:hypothetical protein
MKKSLIFIMLAIFLFGLVSAHGDYYNFYEDYDYKEKIVEGKYFPEDNRAYSRTTYIDYDNNKRYSTEEYKYGYSYRATTDYRDDHYSLKKDRRDYSEKKYSGDYRKKYDDHRPDYQRDTKDYYYKYVPYLREYQKKECYHTAPKGKLFYIKCP